MTENFLPVHLLKISHLCQFLKKMKIKKLFNKNWTENY